MARAKALVRVARGPSTKAVLAPVSFKGSAIIAGKRDTGFQSAPSGQAKVVAILQEKGEALVAMTPTQKKT